MCLFEPQLTLDNPLQALLLQDQDFSGKFFGPNTQGDYDTSWGFGHLGQNPAGATMQTHLHILEICPWDL